MNLKFLIRADANPTIGAGHIMRCLPLIEVLSGLKYEVEILGSIEDLPWVDSALINTGARIHKSLETLMFDNSSEYILILDSYTLAEESLMIISNRWKKVIVIGDSYTPNYACDLFINMSFSPLVQRSKSRAKYFLSGPEYIMTRNEIIEAKKIRNSRLLTTKKIIISGGASDFGNFTHSIVKNIMKLDISFSASIFSRYPPKYNYDSRFTFRSVGSSLVREIEDASVFISTAGTSAFDFLTLGGILGLGCAVENQADNYLQLQANDLAIGVGKCDKYGDWELSTENLRALLADKLLQEKLIANTKRLFNGNGAIKIAKVVLDLAL
jgi:spore coat polysaccharide biosynthesis predicted glycosyltransferase SpsG